MMVAALLFGGTFILGLFLTGWALRFAERQGNLDEPNARSSHTRPTPRGGGLGIALAVIPGLAAGALLAGVDWRTATAVIASTLALTALGYRDDRRDASPAVKMAVQLAAAGVVVWFAGAIHEVALPGATVTLGWLAVPLCVFWLVGFSNAYNFMDGTDGIAGLFGGLAGLGLATAAAYAHGVGVVWLAVPVAAGCLAFLRVNWSPARIFMGDVGSLPIGFLLAAGALLAQRTGRVPFVTSFLVLGPFLFDTLFTLVRRLRRRENLFAAHRSHLYQRLVIAGLSHRCVAVLYGTWTLLTTGLGIVYLSELTVVRVAALGAALLSGVGIWVAVFRLERGRKGNVP